MIVIRCDLRTMKNMFFDRKKIKDKVDARSRKILSKFGSFVRKTARRSIRKRKRSSAPFQPPSSHKGTLKKHIYFGYDMERRSVVIGPVRVPTRINSSKTLPGLEYGGRIDLLRGGTANIKPRPFMEPAFQRELPKVPTMWADSIK